ncbi:MAG: glutathionylspermidine synthase family protein [Candidatus Cloacimonetes bacterium]|nr:glutathionylspermidine synthase family protein [Candidatus Cloacimonadota bacterium]
MNKKSILPIYSQFTREVIEHPEQYFEDYQLVKDAVAHSTAVYKGEPIACHYQPLFFIPDDIARFDNIVHTFSRILMKVTAEYLSNPVFRKFFKFSTLMEELILLYPGYSMPFPMARYDLFYSYDDVDNYKFCEINTDGTSGMNESNPVEKAVLSAKILKVLQKSYRISYFELFHTWIEQLLGIYQEFSHTKDMHPTIAIMDWEGVATIEEFKVFQQILSQRGCTTVICDPRELKYNGRTLFYNDIPIQLVYRRSLTFEICQRADEVKDLLTAYADGNVCMIGPFRSHIIHNKFIFSILHNEEATGFLTEQEREYIIKHVPYTKEFSDPEAKDRVVKDKDQLILKPMDRYAAKGVYIGRDHSPDEWVQIVHSLTDHDEYIVQEFVEPPQLDCVEFYNGEPVLEPYKYINGLFVYNGRFSGLYTRAGKSNVIASATGCKIMPNLYVREMG